MENEIKNKTEEATEQKSSNGPSLMTIIFFSIIVIIILMFVFQGSKATNSDIDVYDQGLYLIVVAKCDIDDLEIEVKLYDKNGAIMERFTKDLGDVEKDEKTRVSLDFLSGDISNLLQLLSASKYSVSVVGGRK